MQGLTSPRPRGARGWIIAIACLLALAGLIALLARPAYEQTFSHLNTPDDEGYVTLTLHSFTDGEALYDDVYSQYGPGYYTFVCGAMKLLRIGFDTGGARWLTLFLWLGSALLAGLALLPLTRRPAVAAVGLAVVFLTLQADSLEPLHPGATAGFVLIALIAAAAWLYEPRPRAAFAAIGALIALLIAVKINV